MSSMLTKIITAATISGALSLGLGVGIAAAAPPGDVSWAQDRGHGRGHDDWYGDDHGRWNGPPPRYWDPVQACLVVGGPFGFVQGSACI